MPRTLNPLLRKLESIAPLSREEAAAVLALPVTIRQMRADTTSPANGTGPSQCCLVLNGWLCRYKILKTGARQIFSFHINGDIPDLQSLHLKTMDHNLGTLVQSTVAFVPHDSARNFARDFPHLGDILGANRDRRCDLPAMDGRNGAPRCTRSHCAFMLREFREDARRRAGKGK